LVRAALLRDAVERDLIAALPNLRARIELLPIGQEPFSERLPSIADPEHTVNAPPLQNQRSASETARG
jgi:hypothetical protein